MHVCNSVYKTSSFLPRSFTMPALDRLLWLLKKAPKIISQTPNHYYCYRNYYDFYYYYYLHYHCEFFGFFRLFLSRIQGPQLQKLNDQKAQRCAHPELSEPRV